MSEAYIGQIMCTAFNFAPKNWLNCDGSILPIAQNQALFSLLGTQFGGDGRTTFQLPDLRGTVPVGGFNSAIAPQLFPIVMGAIGGSETVTLTQEANPIHTHAMNVLNTAGTTTVPADATFAATGTSSLYGDTGTGAPVPLGGSVSTPVGGQAHDNMQPYLVINMSMCIYGLFPPRG